MTEEPTPRRVTASDVAARAGVSISTVSKALSGRGAVRHETRQRILQAATELNYQSNQLAASLSSGRTDTVGVIISDRFGRLTVPVLLGAVEALAGHEIALLLFDGRGDSIREQHFVDALLRRRVDGILVAGAGLFPRESIRPDSPVPIVYALSWSTDDGDTSVVSDDADGSRQAARHLVATGRSKVAFVAGPRSDAASAVRLTSTVDVLAESGLELVHEPLFGQWSERWGRQAANQLLRSGASFDAVVCGSDQIGRGVLEALRENDVRVPEDVAVTGFDNWDVMVEASRPPLTTVDMSLHDVGHQAAELLVSAMNGQRAAGIHRIECQLIPRESTALD